MADVARLAAQLSPALGRRSTYLDLADGLRTLILDGRLVAGEQLPPQRTLAAALQVSRATVVSSLTLLQAEGFLAARQGSGTTVSMPPDRVDRPDSWPGRHREVRPSSTCPSPCFRRRARWWRRRGARRRG